VRMQPAADEELGALAAQLGILLTVHAPYYINLASEDPDKAAASKQRILDSCRLAAAMGARCVVFHAGFYQGKDEKETYHRIREAIEELQSVIGKHRWPVTLCPEVTGKPTQFGAVEEVLRLMQETGCGITVDFAHWYARQQGEIDYRKLLGQLPPKFHAHFSGIEYGPKGEKKHVKTTEQFFKPLARQLIDSGREVTLINESPTPYEDAAMMKKVLLRLQAGKGRRSSPSRD